MTRAEFFRDVAQRLNAMWPHSPLPDATLAVVFDAVRELETQTVIAAIEVLYRDGREFAPTGGQIRQTVAELTVDAPDWAEALAEITRVCAYGQRVRRGGEWVDARAERLEQSPPVVQGFVRELGWGAIAHLDLDDRTAEAQLREKYRSYVRSLVREGALRGLPDGGLPKLRRLSSAPSRLSAAMHQLTEGQS